MSTLTNQSPALSLYLFCRQPNPPNIPANLRTLKLYGLQCGIVPIQVGVGYYTAWNDV